MEGSYLRTGKGGHSVNMYETEEFQAEIAVSDYLEGYVAVEEFLECCKVCPNYGNVWSCPPFDFDAEGYWKRFSRLLVVARKIYLPGDLSQEESFRLLEEVKEEMSRQLFEKEKENPGSVSLSAGNCSICRKLSECACTRPSGEPCRYPEKMRYSIEALGGNVGLTASKLLGIQLEWIEEGKLPSYFVLVGGLLML